LGKPYGIKWRCYWEQFGGTPWELGEPPWEHDENTLRTHDLRLV